MAALPRTAERCDLDVVAVYGGLASCRPDPDGMRRVEDATSAPSE